MFRAHVFIIRMSKLPYTAPGIMTPIGGRLVHETATMFKYLFVSFACLTLTKYILPKSDN